MREITKILFDILDNRKSLNHDGPLGGTKLHVAVIWNDNDNTYLFFQHSNGNVWFTNESNNAIKFVVLTGLCNILENLIKYI